MKRKQIVMAVLTGAAVLSGCGQQETEIKETETSQTQSAEPFVPEIVGTYEAEDAQLKGNVSIGSSREGYSGSG